MCVCGGGGGGGGGGVGAGNFLDIPMSSLTFSILWANSADVKTMAFSYFYQKTGFEISCKLSPWRHFA